MGAHQLLCLYGGIYLITGTAITLHGGVIMPCIMLDMVYSGMQESLRLEVVQKAITHVHTFTLSVMLTSIHRHKLFLSFNVKILFPCLFASPCFYDGKCDLNTNKNAFFLHI